LVAVSRFARLIQGARINLAPFFYFEALKKYRHFLLKLVDGPES
jgi:hypothetical protein